MKRRILSVFVVLCMVVSVFINMPKMSVSASNTANDLVSVAKGELGNGYSKYTQYVGPISGTYNYAWCSAFVSWCGNQAGVSCIGKTASCYEQYQYMISHGGQVVSSPQAGDVVFFYCNSCSGTTNKWCHIGIMIDSSTSIDGNYNSGSGAKVSYDYSYSHYGSLGYKHSSGISKIYVRPNYGNSSAILPGTVDKGWNVPTNVTASHRIATYDQWGNAESNHYIDPGDNCYISEVYTNGFVKVKYPTPNGERWAYAKASDFSLKPIEKNNGLPSTKLHVWFSLEPMGNEVTTVRLNETVYLCYRIETMDGNLLDPSIGNYNVKETFILPDGSNCSYSYQNNNNWIRMSFNQWGTYRGTVELSGDYICSTEVSYTISKPKEILFDSWFSSTPMGSKLSQLEKGKQYYLCYSLTGDNNEYINKFIMCSYSVTAEVYGPDGKRVAVKSYEGVDHNSFMFTATQSGNYIGRATIQGAWNTSNEERCECKDTSPVSLQSIEIKATPKKTTYTVGEQLDTSGLIVVANYSDKSQKNVSGYRIAGGTSQEGTFSVTVSYTEGGITKTASFPITVKRKTVQEVTLDFDSNGAGYPCMRYFVGLGEYFTIPKDVPSYSISITLNPNGGSISNTNIRLQTDFLHWCKHDANGNMMSPFYKAGDRILANKNMTLYAHYEQAKMSVDLPVPVREGYKFLGWYQANGDKVNKGNVIYEKSGKCTLTAKWEREEHTHTPGQWRTTIEATKNNQGEEVRRCEECGEITDTRMIPKLVDEDYEDDGNLEDDDNLEEDEEDEEDVFWGDEDFEDDDEDDDEDNYREIEWNVSSARLQVGQSTTVLEAVVSGDDEIFTYYSSNEKIVSVDENGKITAHKAGSAKITAVTEYGLEASVKIVVQKSAIVTKSLTVNKKNVVLKKGKTFQLETIVNPITSTQGVKYSSSNSKVASVGKNGKIKAKKAGKAVIYVKSGKKVLKINVTVK